MYVVDGYKHVLLGQNNDSLTKPRIWQGNAAAGAGSDKVWVFIVSNRPVSGSY